MFRQFVAYIESAIESEVLQGFLHPAGCAGQRWLPWSLHFMADVRAARTEEKVGHSGRDDRQGKPLRSPTRPLGFAQGRRDDRKKELRGASEIARAPQVGVAGGSCTHSANRVRTLR